jgi:CRP-like cAMP-binding protein
MSGNLACCRQASLWTAPVCLEVRRGRIDVAPTHRVAARLSDLAEVTAALDALPLSQQALAEMTGLTRKTINAVLRRLQADKVLTHDYRRIVIRDVDRLREIARLST